MASGDDILAALEAGLLKAINAQEYQRPDGTRVRRADVEALLRARAEVKAENTAEVDGLAYFQQGGAFRRAGGSTL